jgi:hypothetical protein
MAGMRYRLRTLLIVLALGPVVIAGAWWGWERFKPRRPPTRDDIERAFRELEEELNSGKRKPLPTPSPDR